MAKKSIAKCVTDYVSNIIPYGLSFKRTRGVLPGINTAAKNFGVNQMWRYNTTNLSGVCHYSTKPSIGRMLRSLKSSSQKVVQMLRKELDTFPAKLETGREFYDPRLFNTDALEKPSLLSHVSLQKVKISAKGTRHQFNYSERKPHILDLIKEDLLIIEPDASKKEGLICNSIV